MDNLTVSILIPAYNVEHYLPICLDSVLNQTYPNLQIIIVDDGSRDNTLGVCRYYAERDKRIEYYHQKNQGVAVTRNHLLENAKGDYVLFVDADDWIELDMVEHLVILATKYSPGLVMCDRIINDSKPVGETPNIKFLLQDVAIKDFLYHEYFVGSLCNKLIQRSLLRDLKFKENISYGEDALFIWCVLQKLNNVVISSKQLYHYRMNEDSISHQSFGEKKLTGHVSWEYIVEDVRQSWPQYLDIALGSFALQDMYLLRAASQSKYKHLKEIKELQGNIKNNIKYIRNTRCISSKDLIYAYIICRCYRFGRFYYKLHKMKTRIG